jgi:signal transduction histidine kinase
MVHKPLQALRAEARYFLAARQLIAAVQQLSLARDLSTIIEIVRHAARELTGADGATFVLREGSSCHYAEEDAIAPLWKGQRFSMTACISGWVMMNRQSAIIEDVFSDPRIPANVYRSTFVKSLAMVPIRAAAPVGAIGAYWAKQHKASSEEVQLLRALADSASIAMENVQIYSELEQRVEERTAQLKAANKELQAFSYSVSHDLRAPLRAITGFSQLLYEHAAKKLDDESLDYLHHIRCAARRMEQLINALLSLARISQAEVRRETINLTQLATEIVSELQAASPERHVEIESAQEMVANGDPHLMRVVLENLFSNAWKYTSNQPQARITFGCLGEAGEQNIKYYVQDNGAGFDMAYAYKLFSAFQRLHTEREFPGTGIGLVTVQRIIQKHGGHIWAEAAVGKGATFYFTLL